MQARRAGILALGAALAACQGRVQTLTPPRPHTAASVAVAAASASPGASTPPVASAAPAPAGGLLQKPKSVGATISGTLRIDANYAVASGAAVIANNGSSLIGKVKGADIISEHGGGLVANNGGNLIAVDASGLISDHGLGLIADGGTGLIGKVKGADLVSDHGGGLVANNGGGLVANNSGNLIGKVKRTLLNTGVSDLPAGGLVVGAVSLADGSPVPVGQDASGHPVYAVYTDAAGRFTLYLPPGLQGNVRLVAREAAASDPRLEYGLVVPPTDTSAADMDEAIALANAYFRVVMVSRIDAIFQADTGDQAGFNHALAQALGKVPPFLASAAGTVMSDIRQVGLDAGIKQLPAPLRRAVLLAGTDALCAYADTTQIRSDAKLAGVSLPPLALPEMARVLGVIADRTAVLLARDPHYFETKPYMIEANRARAAAGRPLFHVRKPVDLGAFVVGEYLTGISSEDANRADEVMADVGVTVGDRQAFVAAITGVYEGLAVVLLSNQDAETAVKTALKSAAAAAKTTPPEPSPTPAPGDVPPSPPAAALPEGQVTTIAGSDQAGHQDGVGAAARFRSPAGLALDPSAPTTTLYGVDRDSATVFRLVVDASGTATVTTLAGPADAKSGDVDGPGTQARFNGLSAVAIGPDHHLYLADRDNHKIKRLDLSDPTFPVTTLAGTGVEGYADGPGASAQFDKPFALGVDPSGDLWVGEQKDTRVRKIALDDPAHPVVTVVGSADGSTQDGPEAQATLTQAGGFAFASNGTVYFSDTFGGRIRCITPDGQVLLVAGGATNGFGDGFWMGAGFFGPQGLWLEPDGRLLVADRDNNQIREITAPGDVSTVAGQTPARNDVSSTDGGFRDGPAHQALFAHPNSIVMDAQGNIYVADDFSPRIRKISRPAR